LESGDGLYNQILIIPIPIRRAGLNGTGQTVRLVSEKGDIASQSGRRHRPLGSGSQMGGESGDPLKDSVSKIYVPATSSQKPVTE